MTREEVEAKAKFIADNLIVGGEIDRDYLERMMSTLVSQAFEEAAREICEHCADGRAPARCDEPRSYPYEHRYADDDVVRCRAYPIRALKDSLTA